MGRFARSLAQTRKPIPIVNPPVTGPRLGFRIETTPSNWPFPVTDPMKAEFLACFDNALQRPRNGGIVLGGAAQIETPTTALADYANIGTLDSAVAILQSAAVKRSGGATWGMGYAPPNWASGATDSTTANTLRILDAQVTNFANFCAALVSRYGFEYFAPWNEGKGYRLTVQADWDLFITMMDACYDAIKTAAPSCKVVGPYSTHSASVRSNNGAVTQGFPKLTTVETTASGVFQDNINAANGWYVDGRSLDFAAYYYLNTTKYDVAAFDCRMGAEWDSSKGTPYRVEGAPASGTYDPALGGTVTLGSGTVALDDLDKLGMLVDWHRARAKADCEIVCMETYIKDGQSNPTRDTDFARVLASAKAHGLDHLFVWGDANTPTLIDPPYDAGGVETATGVVMRTHTAALV